MPISVSLQGPPISLTDRFFRETTPAAKTTFDSDLLQSIRIALQGSGTDLTAVHSSIAATGDDPPKTLELSWNARAVILSDGGVIRRKWNFEEEGQPVQWACLGWLEQSSSIIPGAQSSTSYASDSDELQLPSMGPKRKSTFGPFAQAEQQRRTAGHEESHVRTVFVFLRSIGKMFLWNGLEFPFGLPFIVRRAWPLYPHGVMIQRVLEPFEVEESNVTGELTLPTIFSITSPYAEAGAVGVTSGIVRGCGQTAASLVDEDENTTKPLKSIPASEVIIDVTCRGPEAPNDDIVVTIDVEQRKVTIWGYAYVKPKDTPVPLGRKRVRSMARKRAYLTAAKHHRRSSLATDAVEGTDRFSFVPPPHSREPTLGIFEFPPLSALPSMPPALTTTTTMASLAAGASQPPQWPELTNGRRLSLTRNDLSVTMDRMVLGRRIEPDTTLAPIEHGRMKSAHWMERLHTVDVGEIDTSSWQDIKLALFDSRSIGGESRSLVGLCLPASKSLTVLSLSYKDNRAALVNIMQTSAISVASLCVTREAIYDLLVVKPDNRMVVLTYDLHELPIEVVARPLSHSPGETVMRLGSEDILQDPAATTIIQQSLLSVQDAVHSSATLGFANRTKSRVCFDFVPKDPLTLQTLHYLSTTLSSDYFFTLHSCFLDAWSLHDLGTSDGVEWDAFVAALYKTLGLGEHPNLPSWATQWQALSKSTSSRLCSDPALQKLQFPPPSRPGMWSTPLIKPHPQLASILYALHLLGEDLRLQVHRHQLLLRLAPVICRIALVIRPEWADYWKRLCPDALPTWPSPTSARIELLDDRLPVWPPDMSAVLYSRISNPEWKAPWHDELRVQTLAEINPSFAFGSSEFLQHLDDLTRVYVCLANTEGDSRMRAESVIRFLADTKRLADLERLPLGLAAPVREAARTCQLSPPADWTPAAYSMIGRNDLAATATKAPDLLFNDGYRAPKEYIVNHMLLLDHYSDLLKMYIQQDTARPRRTINHIVRHSAAQALGEVEAVSGVELDLENFTTIRFGQDRRLEEIARMLSSSTIPTVKLADRPELNEHDQAKEQQHQVVRVAERTLALPYGRAMFTFGTVPTVTREAYAIPRLEFAVRILPHNVTTAPEPGKIAMESLHWGEFHNGVAAGLRIAPFSSGVESSWIAFNKPSELTPEHAGFLLGLGLTGHLREMLTWHTFGYLTPKHDLTSIGVLLGLSAANVGTGNRHVTKLLAVHTPALLPSPEVDLNVSLMTQAAGLAGLGLLYMGTRNRRMAEVCLNQISRKDLVQPDLSNEHREAYTYAAALAFGQIMLAKGSSIPADMILTSRLRILIHGEAHALHSNLARSPFDINLTSPAATIALGLMYLRTERQDIADILAIPDTVLELNRIQPSFLLMRTVARALILWDSITPTPAWLQTQLPAAIAKAVEACRGDKVNMEDAFELAYFNIIAGCCFAIGLKYAGTARQEAYMMIIQYFDLFSRLVYSNGAAFDHKIRRSAVREGLNLISISLSMVMAGTGEITCFRRLRYAYGMYHHAFRYGIHVATHLSLGLLFLGGGRFTLGTSDAAIACMVMAFFPRFHHVSSDNKSYLQALRHLWVLAVEPRCLIARDVDTSELVYLPIKITTREGNEVGITQLIAPTLIPDLDKLLSIRVDTPRYWPFYRDMENVPQHRESLLRSQTLYVKRRTAFLSYTEDPRGSRSLFVRSGSSAGDAGTLDFPQLMDTSHPAGDLSQFISSFSNNVLFLAFADHFSREDGETHEERMFHTYCHAALLDSLLQDKLGTIQQHLTLYRYRRMSERSRYFHLRLQDLRFCVDFYSKVYDRLFSGRAEHKARGPLIRENTVLGTLHDLDVQLEYIRRTPSFVNALHRYTRGEAVNTTEEVSRALAWYLLRNGVPVSTVLVVLKRLARDAYVQCMGAQPPEGTQDERALNVGIKEVLHAAGTKMSAALGSGWTVRSLDEMGVAWSRAPSQ